MESSPTQRTSGLKRGMLIALVGVLAGIALYAAVREQRAAAPTTQSSPVNPAFMAEPEHSALSPEEEIFAATLWPVHSAVKLAAVRMTFAGINYKTQGEDKQALLTKVQPLAKDFRDAAERARKITPPATLSKAHSDYIAAIEDYAQATERMIQTARDGNVEHLVAAQKQSESASIILLKLSDQLWPGEYKPN